MRVLIINSYENIGGPAIAANRLMKALRDNGVKANMLVRDKQSDKISVISLKRSWWKVWQFIWERIVIWKANNYKRENLFAVDIANTGTDITKLPEFKQADVIHIHWINQGMLSLKDIKKIIESNKAIVWTMHDMWPFTGICHYSNDCTNYYNHCNNCPLIINKGDKDLSFRIFEKKNEILKDAGISFVSCSRWLENMAKNSFLLKEKSLTCIPNAINTNVFKREDKEKARNQLKLPKDMKLILFGSLKISDKRKGFDYLVKVCNILKEENKELGEKIGLVIFGNDSEKYNQYLSFPIFPLNYVNNEKTIIDIYNAVDVYVTPSLSDNLPNTIMEAMSCGTPCVGFNVGGIPEMIDHKVNGYVAEYKSSQDLANGVEWVLEKSDYESLSNEAV